MQELGKSSFIEKRQGGRKLLHAALGKDGIISSIKFNKDTDKQVVFLILFAFSSVRSN